MHKENDALNVKAIFADALHLRPRDRLVDQLNTTKLAASNMPVLIALTQGGNLKNASDNETKGLTKKYLLIYNVKVRVMLTNSIWTCKWNYGDYQYYVQLNGLGLTC